MTSDGKGIKTTATMPRKAQKTVCHVAEIFMRVQPDVKVLAVPGQLHTVIMGTSWQF